MTRFLTLPAGRRAKWIVFAVWIVAIFAVSAAQLPSKFSAAEKNESTSFLPGSAESTKALAVTKRLQGGERAATVIVYQRREGLAAADRARIAADVRRLDATGPEFPQATRFSAPTLSQDGSTALIVNSLKGNGKGSTIRDPVERYRSLVSGDRGGLVVKVTGPAGFSADAIKVFEGINGTLIGAAVLLVLVLLIIIYRSPFFWFFPLLAVGFGELVSRAAGYGLTQLGVTVNGQSSSILSVLVLGAGTDYALLLVARYREELRHEEDRHVAMARALSTAGPAIVASALTVSIGLLSLSLAKVNGTSGLGPIGAMGILVALVSQMTFLPALLVIVGRRPFWPYVPHVGDRGTDATHGAWRRIGERVAARPGRVALATTALLAVMCFGLLNFSDGLTQSSSFRDRVESVDGQKLIAAAFPAGASAPTDIVVRDAARVAAVVAAVQRVDGVAQVRPTGARGPEGTLLAAALTVDPYAKQAYDLVPKIRAAARSADPRALVGGPSAVEHDLRAASAQDTRLLVPLTLLIVFVILGLLLRAIVAPLLLIATVVLSFAASLGLSALVFDVIFGFPGSDPSLPLFAFIFLVALGVDYNIFLMARVREEAMRLGTREGMLRGLAVTGGVITSAGIVLAGTFSVLAVLPLVFLTELGFTIAFGVLLDTFLVRSVLVPALVLRIGPRAWWPSALAGEDRGATGRAGSGPVPTG
ncbi:MMPL family transporter [Baekduia soli]|uniref:MMPL family transporter n=1 Tax=Baekduia soli TaxID=496014 RepID=A0A5B8U4K7_9ACTN|nr:MMPL family transporter [Baekduia soli]QEC48046.1 MMPL family transporter [Baekduia soli]